MPFKILYITPYKYISIITFTLFFCCACNVINIQDKNTVKDIDGNEYKAVVIGEQQWMAENLRVTRYNDGNKIIHSPGVVGWLNLAVRFEFIDPKTFSEVASEAARHDSFTTGGYCWYDNDLSNINYGLLYNWYAVDTKKLCPTGWHIPTDADWLELESYVDSKYKKNDSIWFSEQMRGYDAGKKLKSDIGWPENDNGTDEFGFSGLPAGSRTRLISFSGQNKNSIFWTSNDYSGQYGRSPQNSSLAWGRELSAYSNGISRNPYDKRVGASVRCIKTKDAPVAQFSSSSTLLNNPGHSIHFYDKSLKNPIKWHWDFGDGNYSNVQNPIHNYDAPGRYTVTLIAINEYGSDTIIRKAYIQVFEYGTVTDIEGNTYDVVTIGDQVWMAENLRTTTLNDGIVIPEITDSATWTVTNSSGYCWYENDSSGLSSTFGPIYNWFAVSTNKLCPVGWHVPTDSEWLALNEFLKENGYAGDRGRALKAQHGWIEKGNGTDKIGFKGLPGGYRNNNGAFHGLGYMGYWIGCSDDNSDIGALWLLFHNHFDLRMAISGLIKMPSSQNHQLGTPIRCIKNQ